MSWADGTAGIDLKGLLHSCVLDNRKSLSSLERPPVWVVQPRAHSRDAARTLDCSHEDAKDWMARGRTSRHWVVKRSRFPRMSRDPVQVEQAADAVEREFGPIDICPKAYTYDRSRVPCAER